MFEIIFKAFVFVIMVPYWILKEAYQILNKFFSKHGHSFHWTYSLLTLLIIILIILLLLQYGYS